MAVLAGLMNDLALSAAAGAGRTGGKHAHGRLPPDLNRTGAVALRAHLRRGAGGAAVAVAGLAGLHPLHGDGLFAAECRLFKADGQRQPDALAPLRGVGIGPPAAAEAAAKEAAEDIAQVSEVKTAVEPAAGAEVRVYAGVAVLIIAGFFVGVGKHLIGLVDFLEPGLGLLVAGMEVRMVLLGQLAVRLFDLGLRSSPGDAQDLIIISFLLCHTENSSYSETPYQGQVKFLSLIRFM